MADVYFADKNVMENINKFKVDKRVTEHVAGLEIGGVTDWF